MMIWHPSAFPADTQCSWDQLQMHSDPDQDEAATNDEFIN